MTDSRTRDWWAVAALVVLVAAVAAGVSYNVGLSQGLAQVPVPTGSVPPYAFPYWHRPWGFGFGFPLLFLLFWFFMARVFFWGRWGGHGAGPWARERFEDWHREAHARMSRAQEPARPDSQ